MNDETKVYVRARRRKNGRPNFHIQWIDPATKRWKSELVGPSRKQADQRAAFREKELADGTHRGKRRTSWEEFTTEHVKHITGEANRKEAARTLKEFGAVRNVTEPRRVTFGDIEAYADHLRSDDVDNATATINKKLRYLRAAFKLAVRRGYVGQNPMDGWQWTKEDEKDPRIATDAEESAILESAGALYGHHLQTFIRFALATGARRSEIIGLTWDNIDLGTGRVRLTKTKGKRNRTVYIDADLIDDLQALKSEALKGDVIRLADSRGPFAGLRNNLGRTWRRIVRKAMVLGLSIHDLRRTYITRQIQAGTPLPTVQRLAGHADIKTTLKFYNLVAEDDLKAAVQPSRRAEKRA